MSTIPFIPTNTYERYNFKSPHFTEMDAEGGSSTFGGWESQAAWDLEDAAWRYLAICW